MRDISKAIVDGSLEHISQMEKTLQVEKQVAEDQEWIRNHGNRYQRRALAALEKRTQRKQAKIDELSRKLPAKS